jgi:signal transduction histidine kinase
MDRAASGLSQRLIDVLAQLLELPAGDMKATLSHASDVIARSSGSDKVDAFLYDATRDSLVAVGSSTQPLSMLQRELGLDVLQLSNGGRVVHVFNTGKTFLSGRLDQDPEELPGIKHALNIKSKLGVPLVLGGERRGMMMLASQQRDFFSEEDARFMETVGPWVGLVAHRAELSAEIARNATEHGRRAGAEELVTVLAHDLRNYLSPINMRLDVLRMRARHEGREDELRDVDALGRSVSRLAEIVNDILDMARIDQGIFAIDPRPVDVGDLVRTVIGGFESAQHAIRVTVQPGTSIRVSGDAARLRQCLDNLIANAIQKSPASAAVNIFVRRKERGAGARWAEVEVIDEGPGIPTEQLPHLFERFYTRSGGLGLGLYLAERIARIHGGRLSVESAPGKGARFILGLPALPD